METMNTYSTYICKGCNLFYNLSSRIPMIISCGHIICNQCVQHKFQNNKTLITCHQGDSCNQVEDFKLTPVKELMFYLDKLPDFNITCDTHPHKMVKIHCKKTNKMVCKICSTDCNNGHHEEIDHQNIVRKDLENYIAQKIPSLKNLLEKIQVLIQNLQQYQNKDKMFGASEFLDMITQINKYLVPDQSLEGQSLFHFEKQNRNSKLENLESMMILNQKKPDEKDQLMNELLQVLFEKDKPKYFRRLVDQQLGALKLQETKDKPKLLPIIGQTKLLYKATIDGFTANSFHSKCDNQGPTISFIQSEYGLVFGGYTFLSWTSDYKWNEDNDAFVFSLSKNTLHKQYQTFDLAIGHFKDYLMRFCGDIKIYNDCNNNSNSYCNLGQTYMPPQGLKYQEQQANDYLAGSYNYKVIEIEVYQVFV